MTEITKYYYFAIFMDNNQNYYRIYPSYRKKKKKFEKKKDSQEKKEGKDLVLFHIMSLDGRPKVFFESLVLQVFTITSAGHCLVPQNIHTNASNSKKINEWIKNK